MLFFFTWLYVKLTVLIVNFLEIVVDLWNEIFVENGLQNVDNQNNEEDSGDNDGDEPEPGNESENDGDNDNEDGSDNDQEVAGDNDNEDDPDNDQEDAGDNDNHDNNGDNNSDDDDDESGDESEKQISEKKDLKADIKEMEETLEDVEDALDKNEDLDGHDEERLKALNKVDVIKDTLKGNEIFDNEKVADTLLKEKVRLEDEIRNKENKLSEYSSGNSTPTPINN